MLHVAADGKQALTMEYLLEEGANVEQLNDAGYRAIGLSYRKKHLEGIFLLQKYGVSDPKVVIGKLENGVYHRTYDGILGDVLNGVNLEGEGKSVLKKLQNLIK